MSHIFFFFFVKRNISFSVKKNKTAEFTYDLSKIEKSENTKGDRDRTEKKKEYMSLKKTMREKYKRIKF